MHGGSSKMRYKPAIANCNGKKMEEGKRSQHVCTKRLVKNWKQIKRHIVEKYRQVTRNWWELGWLKTQNDLNLERMLKSLFK